ncbi:extracellular solute-binding protein [Clostridium sp. AL.422]|uniref:ABC transporter substrate-binding protein n=1 Tax=Clostridium TaxID=1485 RepID=UPI00293DEB26|nr:MULTISPECIES: extracellular solute-binding protein [unclassified Clostridium]MDV4150420.1 extracellular solute-binding protein [Clostridium sp. AL.422]
MRIKKLTSIIMAAVLSFGLVACSGNTSGGTDENTGDAASEKITIWAWDEAFNIVAANKAKEIYLKDNPDAEIEVVTMAQDDIVAKLNTSLSSGSYEGLPNVVLVEDYRIQGYLQAYQDEFADLSSVAKPEDFAEYKTGVNYIDGKLYGIPFDSGVAATFYRTDLIEQAGYTKADMENLTWEKYIEIGKAVKEKTGAYMLTLDPSDLGQIRMMLQSAGSWYTGDDGKVTVADNQALKDAIKIYQDLTEAGIAKQTADWDQFVGAFNNGEVASVVTGCWITPSIRNAEDQSGKWAIAAFPKMSNNADSVNASSIGGAGWYALKNVGNTDMAVDFLGKTFASNVDLMNDLADAINLVSTLNAASGAPNYSKGNDFFAGQEIFGDFAKWTSEVPSVNYGLHTYAVEDIMTEAVQAILGGADVDETLKSYQTQIEAAVAQ